MAFVASLLSVVTTTYCDDGNVPAENEAKGGVDRPGHESSIALSRAWSIVQNRLKALKTFTLVVDGLDECDADEADFALMMNHILDLQKCPNMRVLISCRPQARILPYMASGSHLQIQLGGCDDQRQDAWTFLSTQVDKQVDGQQSLAVFRPDITRKMSNLPELNFQLVKMFIIHVRGAETSNRTQKRIEQFPPDLWCAYQAELDSSNNKSNLDHDRRRDRKCFFMLMLGAETQLTVSQMRIAHAVNSTNFDPGDLLYDPENTLLDLCYPFIRIVHGTVSFTHSSVIEFFLEHVRHSEVEAENMRFTRAALHSNFAWKCLSTLCLDRYSSSRRIGMLLRCNMEHVSSEEYLEREHAELDDFYDYAAKNWATHLTKVQSPDDDLLRLANHFINGSQFAHWAEYVLSTTQDMNSIFGRRTELVHWKETIPEASQGLVDISKFLEGPYTALSTHYRLSPQDKELPWLCHFRVATYYLLADSSKVRPFLDEAVRGLTELLGEEHPLTLRARVNLAKKIAVEGKNREARDELLKIWEIQREVMPAQSPEPFITLQLAGVCSFFLTEFELAEPQLRQAHDVLSKQLGVTHYETLCTQLYLGYVFMGLGRNRQALQTISEVHTLRSEAQGDRDGLSIMSLCARGQSEGLVGDWDKARGTLQAARDLRLRIWAPTRPNVIDTAIHLIITHRECGEIEEAEKMLKELDIPHIQNNAFARYCQVKHLQALLQNDRGEAETAVHNLERLVDEGGRDGYNRWLLWARLSLYKMKTDRGEEDEALVLFDNIIQERSTGNARSPASEPDSPRVLRLARDLVELVRQRRYEEADALLQEENLEWVREEDFWILPGGPMAETAWMKGP